MNLSPEDLDDAVAAGVLSADTAAALRAHVARRRQPMAIDEEHFRLVTGFNDVFVVIASVLLLMAVHWFGNTVAAWFGGVAAAVAAWGLAEVFVRRRRMALPAIVLLLAFELGTLEAVQDALDHWPGRLPAASLAAWVGAWLHWRRFRVPITVAAGAAAATGCVLGLLLWAWPGAGPVLPALAFALGLGVFGMAMRWDATDLPRQTRRSDVAFWLHLLAAPLLVHPVFVALDVFGRTPTLSQALLVLLLYLAMALVSLAVDRRALMVSALGYVLYTFTALLQDTGALSASFALTALVIGGGLLLLSAAWHRCRALTLRRLPPGLLARLPPLGG